MRVTLRVRPPRTTSELDGSRSLKVVRMKSACTWDSSALVTAAALMSHATAPELPPSVRLKRTISTYLCGSQVTCAWLAERPSGSVKRGTVRSVPPSGCTSTVSKTMPWGDGSPAGGGGGGACAAGCWAGGCAAGGAAAGCAPVGDRPAE
eukprot:scaffold12144_cov91-Phaeocystis_antarctica.AAC.1